MTDISKFDFTLPGELIANYPKDKRDSSKLMVLHKDTGDIEESVFASIGDFLNKEDLLIFNDTKVVKARLRGVKATSGNATGGKVEVFFLDNIEANIWHVLIKSSKVIKPQSLLKVIFEAGSLKETVEFNITGKDELGILTVKVQSNKTVPELMESFGKVPLPPYINRETEELDTVRYQTVYAHKAGAVAAPTAGLHFTNELIDSIKSKGVEVEYLTLHTGAATFLPLRVDIIEDHKMAFEYYEISDGLKEKILKAKAEGRRVVAVGTTVTRALESAFKEEVVKLKGMTDIFIYPPYEFKVVDAMVTNFHLPKSTLIMLVSAFAGGEFILEAYDKAVNEKYRFFSYGDAMFIQ